MYVDNNSQEFTLGTSLIWNNITWSNTRKMGWLTQTECMLRMLMWARSDVSYLMYCSWQLLTIICIVRWLSVVPRWLHERIARLMREIRNARNSCVFCSETDKLGLVPIRLIFIYYSMSLNRQVTKRLSMSFPDIDLFQNCFTCTLSSQFAIKW